MNYGYIPGEISGDGEELDVYLLGVEEPVDEYVAELYTDKMITKIS